MRLKRSGVLRRAPVREEKLASLDAAAKTAASQGPELPPWLAGKKDEPTLAIVPKYQTSREEIIRLIESIELELKLLRAAIDAQQ